MIWDTAERLVNRSTLIENNEDAKKIMRAPSKHKSLHRLKSMDGQVTSNLVKFYISVISEIQNLLSNILDRIIYHSHF